MAAGLQELLKGAGIDINLPPPEEEEEEMDEEDMDPEQKYKLWMDNRMYMYDHLVVQKLSHPTLSIQWLPEKVESKSPVDSTHRLILGTFNQEEGASNSLKVYHVDLPKFKGFVDLAEDVSNIQGNEKGLSRQSIRLEKEFPHEGEVNRVQYMPQDPNVIATKANNGQINLYKADAESGCGPFAKLSGLECEGFPLNWSPLTKGIIASGGIDGRLGVWSTEAPTKPTIINPFQSPINDMKFHRKNQNVVGVALEDKCFGL